MKNPTVSIVIPCKNEEGYIENLLDDLSIQVGIDKFPIIIADASSTDNTRELIREKREQYKSLDITIIEGGTPAVGRNRGLGLVNSDYVLFLDSDVRFFQNDVIKTAMETLSNDGIYLTTCKLRAYNSPLLTKLSYSLYNFFHQILVKKYPFAIGAFFMTKTEVFRHRGGVDEGVDNSSDFLASQYFEPSEFLVVDRYIGQDNRRIEKMGYIGMAKHLLKNLWSYHKLGRIHFLTKSSYWK